MGSHASTITATAVRVAGEIPIEVSVRHLGTQQQEAGMRMGKLHLPARVALVGTIVRLAGYPVCTVVGVPAQIGSERPAHVRIEVGPLAWEVCDQLAWHAITCAWRRLVRQLGALEE